MRRLDVVTMVLLIIGGLNWGLVGFFDYNLVSSIFGGNTATLSRITYILVGLSALYQVFALPSFRSRWGRGRVEKHEKPDIHRAA